MLFALEFVGAVAELPMATASESQPEAFTNLTASSGLV
jgi:hypothetical protein